MKKVEEIKVKRVLANLFKISLDKINDETSIDSIEEWDSLKHLKLVLALEDELQISFTEEETIEIISYPLIKETLKQHEIELV